MRAQLQLSKKAQASYHSNLLQTKSSNYKIHNEGIAIIKESESLEKQMRQYMSELQQIAEIQEKTLKQIEVEKEKVQELREICSKLKEDTILQKKMRDQIRTKIGNHQKVFEQLRDKVRLNSIKVRTTASNLETIQSQFKLFNQIMSLDSSGISIFEEVKEIDPNNEKQNNKALEGSSERRLSVKELVSSFNSQINQTTEASKKDQQFYRDQKQKQNKSVNPSSNEISGQENKNTVLKSNFQDLNEFEQKQEAGFESQSVETFVNKQDSSPSEMANDQIGQYKQQYQDKQYNDYPIEKIALLDLHNKSLTHQNENLNDQFNQLQTQLKDLNLKIQQIANQNNKLVQDNEQVASEIQQAVIERDQAIGEKYALLQQLGQYMEKQEPGIQLSPEEVSQQYQSLISKYASLEEKFVQSKLENNNLKRQIEDMQDQFEQQQQMIHAQKQTIQGLRETLEQNIKKISLHQKKNFKPIQPQNLNQSFSGDPFSYVRNNTEEVESTEQKRQNQLENQQERKVSRGEKEATSQEIQNKMQSSIMRANQIQPDITKQRISKLFGSFDK